jgi:CubicO group peptidase (beta-lactamase class C family)
VANSAATRFRIFSTTKQIIATAVLQLAAKDRLRLDAPVVDILPDLPQTWKRATVRQLLEHTSGIPNDEPLWAASFEQGDARTQLQNLRAIAAKLRGQPLTATPGTEWHYNNFGYDLLGCVIERVSHLSLSAYLRQYIFEPADMQGALLQGRADTTHTMYSGNAVVPGLASGYNGAPHRLETADSQMYASAGAGGIVATAQDLLRYDEALSSGTLLPRQWKNRAISEAFQINSRTGYGYGWIVVHTAGGKWYVHHSGGSNGFTSDYARIPDAGLCIIVLSNYGFAPAEDGIRNRIVEMILGPSYDLPKRP